MTRGRPKAGLVVTDDERAQLTSFARSRSLPASLSARARIILSSADGEANGAIAERLELGKATLLPNRAAELQRVLAELTGHTTAKVSPYGKYLLIQMQRDTSSDTVARLTATARNRYTAAFRTHSGRWEPLPAAGDMRTTAEAVVSSISRT